MKLPAFIPIFNGTYEEFTIAWYRNIGTTISLTMLVNIVSPHIANGIYLTVLGVKRCRDRGCTTDSRKSKMLI